MFNMWRHIFTECYLDGKYLLSEDYIVINVHTAALYCGKLTDGYIPSVCLIKCLRIKLSVKKEIKMSEQAAQKLKGN